jgi:DNA-binding transcriptional ArsR family regulator
MPNRIRWCYTLYPMVKCSSDDLDAVFSALADPTRRAITVRLARGQASVSEIAEPFDLTLPAVMKHLAVLEHASLIEHWKEGRVRYCRLSPRPLESAAEWIEHYTTFWQAQFGALEAFLREDTS